MNETKSLFLRSSETIISPALIAFRISSSRPSIVPSFDLSRNSEEICNVPPSLALRTEAEELVVIRDTSFQSAFGASVLYSPFGSFFVKKFFVQLHRLRFRFSILSRRLWIDCALEGFKIFMSSELESSS